MSNSSLHESLAPSAQAISSYVTSSLRLIEIRKDVFRCPIAFHPGGGARHIVTADVIFAAHGVHCRVEAADRVHSIDALAKATILVSAIGGRTFGTTCASLLSWTCEVLAQLVDALPEALVLLHTFLKACQQLGLLRKSNELFYVLALLGEAIKHHLRIGPEGTQLL